jgi:hypothetical protein
MVSHPALGFDLQKTLAFPGKPSDAGPPTLVDAGLLYTAALWDAYCRVLRATNSYPFFLEAVQALDGVLRVALVALAPTLFVELWLVRDHPPIEFDAFALIYFAVNAFNVLLVVRERLAGRFGGPAPQSELGDVFPYPIVGRKRFSSSWIAFLVSLVYGAVAVSVLFVSLTYASVLTKGPNPAAAAFLALTLMCDVVYAYARLPTFSRIAEQGLSALQAAGLHTLLVLNVELPMGLVYVFSSMTHS